MKRPLIFVQDPNALKNWLKAAGDSAKVLFDLMDLQSRYAPQNHILLIQISEASKTETIVELAKQYDIIAFSNTTNDFEGLQLFQQGVKGYLNAFATPERIQQAIETVQSGNVWLGQSVMQAMISSLLQGQPNMANHSWKEKLTERELEATELVLQSKTNKEIAESLSITERTVKAHLHNVFEKLDVSDRLALVLKINNWA
ncbi:response regulator transcription factor [Thiomicrorhabdus sediminis]|uniref:Response regulator transcription factor n=1 Tax=Thiomicrorhabdus sediminis TaxID=2580412 RepID=A0A4P9K3V4_9GAMM|nr:response regulator transcription factor [Thiomicrorhabdus sediminis]QCU89331.1 response regulator transcription factor [Thiomicrorhabdus sediminis]